MYEELKISNGCVIFLKLVEINNRILYSIYVIILGGYTLVFGVAVGVMFIANVFLYLRIRSFEWKPKITEVIFNYT